jgi:dGTPase
MINCIPGLWWDQNRSHLTNCGNRAHFSKSEKSASIFIVLSKLKAGSNKLLEGKMKTKFPHLKPISKNIWRTSDKIDIPLNMARNEFDRDRDRILYSKAFRRLSGKTQVFVPYSGDHLRTRLTHTIEVQQISRLIAKNLGLDETLTEAIALGHDLGHTPFGHVGEQSLNQIMNNCDNSNRNGHLIDCALKGFKHNLQGLRVVCDLEAHYGRSGIQLTNFTLWGIKNHTKSFYKKCPYYKPENGSCYCYREPMPCPNKGEFVLSFFDKYEEFITLFKDHCDKNQFAWSFEAFIVSLSDEIAQRHHDLEDSIIMGIMGKQELIDEIRNRFKDYIDDHEDSSTRYGKIFSLLEKADDSKEYLSYLSKLIISLYITDMVKSSRISLFNFCNENSIKTSKDFLNNFTNINLDSAKASIGFSPELTSIDADFHDFIKNRIINSFKVQQMDGRGTYIIKKLFNAYVTNPRQLYDATIRAVYRLADPNGLGPKTIGEMRNEIDGPDKKTDLNFQNCLQRAICDFISGMTDNFAEDTFNKLYN